MIYLLPRKLVTCSIVAVLVASAVPSARGQNTTPEKRRSAGARNKYGLQTTKGNAIFTIKNVDITHFPEMGLIFSAVNNRNEFIRTLRKEDVVVLENGQQRPIISLDQVSGENRVPIDIVFVIDQTASITDMIGIVKA